jgi:hypothetical protein
LDNQSQNIDQSIRDKFENFAPTPPAHIWEGVMKGVATQAKPTFFAAYGKQIGVAASVLLLAALGLWWFLPVTPDDVKISEVPTIELIDQSNADATTGTNDFENKENDLSQQKPVESITENDQSPENQNLEELTTNKVNETKANLIEESSAQIAENTLPKEEETITAVSNNTSVTNLGNIEIQSEVPEIPQLNTEEISPIDALAIPVENETEVMVAENPPVATEIVFKNPPKSNSSWTSGVYFTAEFMLNDFDSVQLLPTYSLNYEPSYHFNDHLFLRFGVGMSYARDRGFAQIDYISNEVVGTYENVYDITFDSIDGVVVPTYHTKTTEVWDSVQHIQVSEITNKYLYIQTPVLFGYYKQNTRFNWYFYGGPTFNVLVSKQIANPQDDLEGAEIIDLDNNLPERSPYFMQLWVGAGIEYKVGNKMALSIEPNYRYYFNNVYKNDPYKSALSSFSLRFGVVFTMK